MDRPQCMWMPIKIIPQEITDKYNLLDIIDGGWVYIKTGKGMCGMPQAGKTENNLLTEQCAGVGNHPE